VSDVLTSCGISNGHKPHAKAKGQKQPQDAMKSSFLTNGYTIARRVINQERAFALRLEIYKELGLIVRNAGHQKFCDLFLYSQRAL
jgi:hypothetical protein